MNILLPFEWRFAGGPRVLCLLGDYITDLINNIGSILYIQCTL